MTTTIAISGKGGSGKTTIAAMIIKSLLNSGNKGAILAVDADPNSCLGFTLGVQTFGTVADIRENARDKPPAGMDRLRSVDLTVAAPQDAESTEGDRQLGHLAWRRSPLRWVEARLRQAVQPAPPQPGGLPGPQPPGPTDSRHRRQ